ncbi:hypothetical protein [Thalassotalea agariperforans]
MYKFLWLLSFISFNSIAKNIEAPFGFEWGMSQKNIEAKQIQLIKCESELNITSCESKSAIKNVSFGDVYYLYFDSKLGLQKIKMLSKDITSDSTGTKGKALYEKIKSSLIKKYSEPKSYEIVGGELYTEHDDFYQCLKYDGCGIWSSLWNNQKGGVVLDIHGLKRGHGFLSLSYESEKWSDVLAKYQTITITSDEDAL